jgi:membrane fusion protein (multidrug efflux system)
VAASLLLAACGDSGAQDKGGGQPTSVGYVVVRATTVPVEIELYGRVAALQSAEVRPQVAGVIQRRLFTEGSVVRQGQTLYQVDPSLYRAASAEAQAAVNSATATAEAARVRANRLKPLADMEAVSRQDYTDALAQSRQAAAQVAQARAVADTARINLRFTSVPAPITGRIGRSLFTEGALVTANQAEPLAVIQRLDPIYVDMQQSSADLVRLRRALAAGGAAPTSAQVRLKLEDGSDYGTPGIVQFSEMVVNEATGTVTLRARFPNPQNVLLPGMFVQAQFDQAVETNAILVPQAALTRDFGGNAYVFLVGKDNKAVRRKVQADRTYGASWVILSGLAAGEKIITQGTSGLKGGAAIRPVPASTPQRAGSPPSSQGATPRAGG